MEEKKNSLTGKKKLTDEKLEQVTGGENLPFSNDAAADCSAAASSAVNAAVARSVSDGAVAGAAMLVGGAWAIIDHQQPSKTVGHHEVPKPTHDPDPRSR